MGQMVRAVSDKEAKWVGFDATGKRRRNGEEFEWPTGRDMPLVVRGADGSIKSGWVVPVGAETPQAGKSAMRKKGIPGLVTKDGQPARTADDKPMTLSEAGETVTPRASDRPIG